MITEPGGYFRASHADRGRVVDILKAAFLEGRLTEDELDARVARALGSRTYAELAVVTADLPAGPAGLAHGPAGLAHGPAGLAHGPAGKTANLTPFLWGVGVLAGIPVILLAMGLRLGNEYMEAWGMLLFVLEFVVFILAGVVAVGTAVDSRMKKRRAGEQPPPGSRGTPPSGVMTGPA